MTRWGNTFALTLGCLLLAGCGGKGGGNGNNNHCPEGFRPEGRACVPIFDDCPGPAEIPVLGGGCQAVGVTQCATGFVSDGEGGCDPILPSESCPPGTMEVIGETECQPVGVTQCADGFVSDGEGGCDAILPPGPGPCPFGTMEVLGHTDCQPIGDCGTGTWGNITTDATTIFVDQTADATGADGSDASPFTTIEDALAVVQPGGQIAVAAGGYTERLLFDKRVHLAGRCAELVTIRGTRHLGQDRPPVQINAAGSGTTIRSVTLTGDMEGLIILGAQAVTVVEVQVLETGSLGVVLTDEAEARLARMVVGGCTHLGVFSEGSSLEVSESVVRDTVPLPDGTWGQGIGAQCDDVTPTCGSLTVTGSLVIGNSDAGIALIGVSTSVVSTVIRDTLPADDGGARGRGIHAQCDSRGTCGSLTVTGSLLSGNTTTGILALGFDVAITSTVVRDTLPRQVDGTAGRGIRVGCHPDLGTCGSLTVNESVLAGNRDLAIIALGADAAISSTIVRDTLPQQSDGIGGRGVTSECHPDLGTCGHMTVTGSLVAGNREVGVFTAGVSTSIASTVVRDTLPQESNGTAGHGIIAQCNTDVGACGGIAVTRSLVEGNRELGIFSVGEDVAATQTVVRDTLPRPGDGNFGRGIHVQCSEAVDRCGSLTLTESLVTGNREVGISVTGVGATLTSTVVRDTLPQESDGQWGRGITAQCQLEPYACASVNVTGSLFAGNREAGVNFSGADGAITSTIVRDTLPQESDGRFGRGINAQCDPDLGACGSLSVTGCLVAGNQNAGIFVMGLPAVLSGVAVRDTVPNGTGPWANAYGAGIFARCVYPDQGRYCTVLQMSQCIVESSYSAAMAIQGGSGSMYGSLIRNVVPRPLDDAYGYGLQVEGLVAPGAGQTFFDVQSCRIIDATLAGVLYVRAGGTVVGSEVGGAGFSIVMNQGATVTVTDDNELSGHYEDEPTWQNMEPCPAPEPALPVED